MVLIPLYIILYFRRRRQLTRKELVGMLTWCVLHNPDPIRAVLRLGGCALVL